MKSSFRTLLLGLATLVVFCAAVLLQALSPSELWQRLGWGAAGAFLLAWLLLNRLLLREFFLRKSTRYGANLALVVFLVLGIVVFLNVLGKEYHWRKDLTRAGINTLSEQSRKLVKELKEPVRAHYFASLNEREKGEDLFRRYRYVSPKFQFEFIDVDRNPTRAAAMGVKRKGAVALTLGDAGKKVMVDQPTEEQLTNGLIKLLRSSEVAVYFTVGHEEHSLESEQDPLGTAALKAELGKQGYTVKTLNLLSEGKIPGDAAALLVTGPKKAFFPKELELLSSWIRGGGRVLLAMELDPAAGGLTAGSRQLAGLLKEFGVEVSSEMLVDPTSRAANVEPQVLLGFSGSREHPVTRDFAQNAIVANFLFPLTTYLRSEAGGAWKRTPLATSSANAWAESDWDSLRRGRVTLDKGRDHQGRMDLAYAVEAAAAKPPGKEGEKEGPRSAKLAVFANSIFLTNNLLDKVGNRDLVMNTVAWLSDEERFISIRAKEDNDGIKRFDNVSVNWILMFTVFVLPLAFLGAGISVWWRRSKL